MIPKFLRNSIPIKSLEMTKRRKPLVVVLILAILAGNFYWFFLRNPQEAKAAWFDENWGYRQKSEITNSGSNQTDFQVAISLDTATLITAGKMQSDCDDLRITDINGQLLYHWLETGTNACNTATTKIWTKAPSITTAGATLYIYYGNTLANNVASGSNVFEFFDDFSANSLDTVKWTNSGTPTFSSGIMTLSANTFVASARTVTATTTMEVRFREATANAGSGIQGVFETHIDSSGNYHLMYYVENNTFRLLEYYGASNYFSDSATWTGASTTWRVGKLAVANSTLYWYEDGTQKHSRTLTNYTLAPSAGQIKLWAHSEADNNYEFDWVFTRKGVNTEPSVGSPASEEKGPGPVSYWKLDEGYGTTANDSMTARNTGTLTNMSSVASSTSGWQPEESCVSGKCLGFDGGNDYISVGDQSSLEGMSSLTLSSWVKLNGNGPYTIVSKDNSSNARSYYLQIASASNTIRFLVSGNGSTVAYFDTTSTLATSTWYYIAGVFNGSTLKVYINGVEQAGSTTGSVPSSIANTNTSVIIGALSDASVPLKGSLDDFKIYNYARSAAQVKADYISRGASVATATRVGGNNQSYLSDGLVGYWKMDEASWSGAGAVVDSSGNSKNGTSTNATVAAGKFGNSGDFNGSNAYVDVPTASTLQATSNFTVSAWVNLDNYNSNEGGIVCKAISSPYQGWCLEQYNNGGTKQVKFTLVKSGFESASYTASSTSWELITATVDSSNTARLYRNGDLQATTVFTTSITDSGSSLIIGDFYANAHAGTYTTDGKIDDVRIYNRALSDKEVRDLYNWAPGPVGYWNMDERTGQSAYDQSGNANAGTLGANSSAGSDDPTWAQGKFGPGLSFDGGDYVTVSDNVSLRPSAISYGAWFKTTANSMGIISKKRSVGSSYVLAVETIVTVDPGKIVCGKYDATPQWQYAKSSSTYNDGNWHHAMCVHDGTQISIYIDGVLQNSSSASALDYTGSDALLIGDYTGSNKFNGSIDDVRIYNYARTQKQVVEDMNVGHPAVGSPVGSAVGYWKFDDGYGTTAQDSSPQNNDGVLTNGPTWSNNGKFGKAVSFAGSGSQDYVSVSDANSLETSNVTMTAWVKLNSLTKRHGIVGKWADNNQSYLLIVENDNKPTMFVSSTGANNTSVNSGSTTLTADTWYHLAASYDGATIKVYIDGVEKGSSAYTAGLYQSGNAPVTIGWWNVAGSNLNAETDGLIDEPKIYNYALTADEVKVDYNRGAAMVLGTLSTSSSGVASSSAAAAYCVPGDTAACSPPVGEWTFDERTGQSANDTSGNGNTGTLGASSSAGSDDPTWTSGKVGAGLKFDGTDDDVEIPYSSTLNAGSNITGSAWIYLNATSGDPTIFTKRLSYYFTVGSSGNINAYTYGTTPEAWLNGSTSIPLYTWTHVAFTYNGSVLKLYVNGKEDGSSSRTGSVTQPGTLLDIGNVNTESRFFTGKIDDVRIYNYARTPAQIAWDYNRGGPVGWWKMDDCQGLTAYDASGNANNGTITIGGSGSQTTVGTCTSGSGAWYNGASGKRNSSLNFDGTDDYVNLGETSLNASSTSVSAWVKLASTQTSRIFVAKYYQSPVRGWGLGISDSNNNKVKWYTSTDAGTNDTLESTYALNNSEWYHVVGTFDGATKRLYINGVLDNSVSWANNIGHTATVSSIGYLRIAGTQYFSGQIDDARVYNYALTAAQIQMLYNESAVRFGPATGAP